MRLDEVASDLDFTSNHVISSGDSAFVTYMGESSCLDLACVTASFAG